MIIVEIRINTNEVKSIKDIIAGQIDDLEDNTKNLLANLEQINSVWSGTDEMNYINIYKEKFIKNFDELKNLLQIYNNDLDIVAKSYDALDETFSNKNIEV